MSDSIQNILRCAEQMFGQVLDDIEPYGPERLVHLLFFRRFTEWQYEYCRTISLLSEANCFQGAIPVLRSLVEVSVAQLLLHRDQDFSTLLELLKGERVKTDDALRKIHWPTSQSDIYARLSQMTHPSRISAFLGRTLDFESEPLKSLVARKDIAGVARVILWMGAREDEEARQERWIFVALNTFDLALSSLFTLYGERAPDSHWWPHECISQFEALAETYPSMKRNLLWFRLPWTHSKYSEVERLLGDILNENGGDADDVASSSQITEYAWLNVRNGNLVSFRPHCPALSELKPDTEIGKVLDNLLISEWRLSAPRISPPNAEFEIQIQRQVEYYPPLGQSAAVALDDEDGTFEEKVRRVQHRFEVNGWDFHQVISATNMGPRLIFTKPKGAPDTQPFAEPHLKG